MARPGFQRRPFKTVTDGLYDAAFGAPCKNISEDVTEKAISHTLASAMRRPTPEHVAEKEQLSQMLPSLTEVFSVAAVGQAKPMGASKSWWTLESGVPKALQQAGDTRTDMMWLISR